MFNPTRLVFARKRRKLTARQLAEKSGITPQYLSMIENGKAENVEADTLRAIAAQLNFPYEFFFGDDVEVPGVDSISFRSLSTMSVKEKDAAVNSGALALQLSDWIEERFNLPKVDLPDMRFEGDPQAAARSLRTYWGIGERPVSNVIKLLESKGVRIFSLAEDTRNVDAFSCWRNDRPFIFLNTFKTAERSRFDAMHELGHLVLHRHGKPQGREAEKEADQFASFFLIPTMDMLGNVPSHVRSLSQLVKLKKRWGVSVAALAYRLHKEGILSDWQYRGFCIEIRSTMKDSEPEGMERERSVVLQKVFQELWKERTTRSHVAKELSLPVEELDNLVFSLLDPPSPTAKGALGKPQLSLA
ncbi:ImmA/IrrE family metallo-endopeptidase [Wenzhouxiangella sp. XN201]|uniref:ImmA/IrrE family metallo-endopeptidase n=1 Tax=Wenzhouxiangella sp. XN201 TaxID=2710755 RepID=UPI0013CDCAF6|nr:ImmA/IrrE family metallo-endopeptidase [Wenzhouxiangella sp. XN201]